MAKQKKLEKAAQKAFERAEEAVAEAREAAVKLDAKKAKKAKKHAKELEKELAEVVGRSERSASAAEDGGAPPIDLTPPLPTVRDESVEKTVEYAGSVTTSAPHDPELDQLTVQALRDVARTRGLLNVSKLTKGQLIERLSE
ncbi:hypothetical protein [Leifsonia shinshuensis]|uniref:hypothetical protein n=1 Tax=Leifsonia shinshuensis TaxID=150026 RepID=UPI00285F6D0A|nr:hypothetical protein [Leifsonia shinshuensis]MDR6969808.1 hypothetical protein [Leifsonia shinshuensis]